MPLLDIVDEHLVAATPERVRRATCDEAVWRQWFPGLRLDCVDDRGPRGKRWTVQGDLTGTAEVWIEPLAEGSVILHVFLQADPPSLRGHPSHAAARLRRRYARPLKARLFAVKDALEQAIGSGHG